ncbi:hypothetical protein LUCX_146 [Xanthomonas phage vB_XciM_LucasX]|nr:hypothetical protein LUCX_146 [Xanthomonas phage vB_XciM_LucasX]
MFDFDSQTDLPTQPGWYNVLIEGVSSFMPIYFHFDGEEWHPDFFEDEIRAGRKFTWFEGTRRDTRPS